LESGPNMFSRFSWMLLTFVGRNIWYIFNKYCST
jgi:hypothetical protein